jgi:glycosyltransferase involved in cell wall biosynthesis
MSKPILTILIPTYNRSRNLDLLLRTLREEISCLADEVVVFVSDNASSDDTAAVVAQAVQGWPALLINRQVTNVGMDNNFCHCVSAVQTRWFWIISDDDLPKRGVIANVVALLRERQPAMVHMQTEWIKTVMSPEQGDPIGQLRVADIDAMTFAKSLHILVTYLSGIVIDRERLEIALQGYPIDRFKGTWIAQLGWVLPMFKTQGPFLFIMDRCMLATADNSGGYPLLTVFCVNFPRIVNDSFGKDSQISQALIGGAVLNYFPGLIWNMRMTANSTSFSTENPWKSISRQLGSWWLYWLLLVPLGRFPTLLAYPFFQAWRVINRLLREWHKRINMKRWIIL